MSASIPLGLHEEALLLGHDPRTGKIASKGHATMAIGAAILAELLLAARVGSAPGRFGRTLIELLDPTKLDDLALDWALDWIRSAGIRHSATYWVQKLECRELRRRTALSLCAKDVLDEEKKRLLGIFPTYVYRELDPAPKANVLERLELAIFDRAHSPDERTLVLLSIAHATGLLPSYFANADLKRAKRHIDELVSGELAGKAARSAIDEANAVLAMVLVSSVVVSIS